MAKFLFVYRGSGETMAKLTPQQQQEHMQAWAKWIGEAMQKGWMVDAGDALMPDGRVVGSKVITDGPFVEAKEIVGGFSIVEANSIDAAAQFAKGCPGVSVGGTVEVRPMAGYTLNS